ncbi:MAG: PRC-barrel domain-containing protein [Nanoarchaeota archaeon]|nr:PRC-barrel domain-containing protein [Nanoarchaeota archaeon]MBU1135642.1 PRC-barrel domain-containing protein [Nanoarchaeota archaeon]MBU2520007.1 PRC-barrel domain-containing protein [Nanoarchaeota archaeon]
MVKVASISDTWQKDVFTNSGLYCGKVEDVECDLRRFKLRSLVVKAVRGSYMSDMLGTKKGMIIPFPMVEAIGDIIIIKHVTAPMHEEMEMPDSEVHIASARRR